MSIFDDLFGSDQTSQQPASATAQPVSTPTALPAAAPVAPGATLPKDYADFYNRQLNALNANIDAERPLSQRGLLNWLTGADRKAAIANLAANAASAWQQYQEEQNKMQGGQLGTAQDLIFINRSLAARGLPPIDPNDIMGGFSAQANGAPVTPGAPPPVGAQANAAPPAPAVGAQANAAPSGGAPQNPLQARRAMFLNMANMMAGLPKYANMIPEYAKLAGAALPDGVTVGPDGQAIDAITGKPVTVDVGTLLATRAGQTAAAQEAPRVAGQEAIAGNQAALDRQTSAVENADKNRYEPVRGYDNTNGQPLVVSRTDVANGRVPNFVEGDNPYLVKQQTEMQNAEKDAQDASNAIIQLRTLQAALNGIHTGKWGDTVQGIRRGLASLGLSSSALDQAATQGDIANQLATEVAALRAKAASGGRTALGTFNVFRNVKPGLLSTNPEAQIRTLIPAYQRQVDYAKFLNGYYGNGKNWNKLDAATAFQKINPDQKYINAAGIGGATPPDPATYSLPASAKFVGWHQGKPVFNVNGKNYVGAN